MIFDFAFNFAAWLGDDDDESASPVWDAPETASFHMHKERLATQLQHCIT